MRKIVDESSRIAALGDIRKAIEIAEDIGELDIIEGADPHLEMGALHELSLQKPVPPVLLFRRIKGYPDDHRVVVNMPLMEHDLFRKAASPFRDHAPGQSRMQSVDSGDSRIVVYIDGDACPVKDEVYKVAARHNVKTFVVANAFIATPRNGRVERVVVAAGADVADDWIAERASRGAIVVTADIPLAARCVKAGADVIAPNGKAFSESSIGMALATRNLMQDLRETGAVTGGPKPFARKDRSAFLSALELAIVRLKRAGFAGGHTIA